MKKILLYGFLPVLTVALFICVVLGYRRHKINYPAIDTGLIPIQKTEISDTLTISPVYFTDGSYFARVFSDAGATVMTDEEPFLAFFHSDGKCEKIAPGYYYQLQWDGNCLYALRENDIGVPSDFIRFNFKNKKTSFFRETGTECLVLPDTSLFFYDRKLNSFVISDWEYKNIVPLKITESFDRPEYVEYTRIKEGILLNDPYNHAFYIYNPESETLTKFSAAGTGLFQKFACRDGMLCTAAIDRKNTEYEYTIATYDIERGALVETIKVPPANQEGYSYKIYIVTEQEKALLSEKIRLEFCVPLPGEYYLIKPLCFNARLHEPHIYIFEGRIIINGRSYPTPTDSSVCG